MLWHVERQTAEDSPGGGDLWYWLRSAVEQGAVSEAESAAWERAPTAPAFVALLEAKGYDGLAYRNEHGDAGSDSVVVFRPGQAVRVELLAAPRFP
jgi:hypothetical protein